MSARILLNLFDRPTEPVFLPKGDNEVFVIPDEFISDFYKRLGPAFIKKFQKGAKMIRVKKVTVPDLTLPLQLDRKDIFSLFIPLHQKMAGRLIEVFMNMTNLEDLISVAACCRDKLNPYLFIYALSVAIYHRPDTKHLVLPCLAEVLPEMFMPQGTFARAREIDNLELLNEREPLEIPRDFTGSGSNYEHRLAYFREDLGVNLHHWHWHLIYPYDGPLSIVNKDRRGELFYYMHQQVIARYNIERFCNSLNRVTSFVNWREPIEEGYFSKLDTPFAARTWPPRLANTKLSNIDRTLYYDLRFDIQDLERWRDRILAAIANGKVVDENGDSIELTESRGIDILGNIIEPSRLSVNINFYGSLHNYGHDAISLCHDPDGKFMQGASIMGNNTTAMRDPIFYRWHSFINDIFVEHKNTLPRYTIEQLDYPGVKVSSFEVQTDNHPFKNNLFTFWQQGDIDMARGLDFGQREPNDKLLVRVIHLQHKSFTYEITVENDGPPRRGTCRIFMAPKLDENNQPMSLKEQKNFFVELDKFTVNLETGENTISRESTKSSVTIPDEQIFRSLESEMPNDENATQQFNYCGCGWPQYMLICKGTPSGYRCQMFVMISDYNQDKVEDEDNRRDLNQCVDAVSYCGLRNKKYPDRRSMGFPFDRQPREGVETLKEFLTPNMGVVEVSIQHSDTITRPGKTLNIYS